MALVFTDTRTSKLYDELLADMILRPHWARSASPPGPNPGHKSPLSSVPLCLSCLPTCDGMALCCLMCLPYEYCMTMYYSLGPPIRNTYLDWASDSYFGWCNAWPLPIPGFFSAKGFESRYFCTYTSNEYFLLTAAILKGCPLLRIRWGAGCWQPKQRLPPAATSNRLCNLRSGPPSMLLSYKGKK